VIKRISELKIVDKPLSWYDWIVFFVLAICCPLFFMQTDILYTGGSSFAILNGHVLDFYDYKNQFIGGNNYFISIYTVFAIWNIPIKLLGLYPFPTTEVHFITAMWFKLLPCIVYLISAFVIYKICKLIGMGNLKSKLCAYTFLTTPIAFFSQFIITQYAVFCLVFMLLGIYFYIKNDLWKFVLFFGIAITFKFFALFFFLPLLFLKEKSYKKLVVFCVGLLLPLVLMYLPFLNSETFDSVILRVGFNPANYMGALGFNIYFHVNLSVFVLLFVVCSAWAFFTNPKDKDDEVKWMFFFTAVTVFLCFGLSMWSPQWILLSVPFLVISTFINKKPDVFLILDILLMFFFVTFVIYLWQLQIDETLLETGILRNMTNATPWPLSMRDIIPIKDTSLMYSAFSVILLINAVFKHPKFCTEKLNEEIEPVWNLIRIRFIAGVSIFIIPAVICLVAMLFIQ